MGFLIGPGPLDRRTSTLRRRLATGPACPARALGARAFGGIRDRRFQFFTLLTDGRVRSIHNCPMLAAVQAAARSSRFSCAR